MVAYGSGTFGRLGVGLTGAAPSPTPRSVNMTFISYANPLSVRAIGGSGFTFFHVSDQSTASNTNHLFACGSNNYIPSAVGDVYEPREVQVLKWNFTKIVATYEGGLIWRASGVQNATQLFQWGLSDSLGSGVTYPSATYITTPVKVALPVDTCETLGQVKLTAVGNTGFVVCQNASQQLLYAFGKNQWGEAGLGHKNPLPTPTLVSTSFLGGRVIAKIAVTVFYASILTSDGSLYFSGSFSCTGGSQTFASASSAVPQGEQIVDISAANYAFYILSSASKLYVSICNRLRRY